MSASPVQCVYALSGNCVFLLINELSLQRSSQLRLIWNSPARRWLRPSSHLSPTAPAQRGPLQPLSGPCHSAQPNTAALDDESTVSSEWTRRRGFPGFSCRLSAVGVVWSCDTGLKTDTIYLLTYVLFTGSSDVREFCRFCGYFLR